jgi:phosphoglycolate phosphatase
MVKNLIFDLDGTLLDTLPDITRAINDALKAEGYGYSFNLDEAKGLIGGGADRLIRKALKDKGKDEKRFDRLKKAYMPLYKAYQEDTTAPFKGIKDALSLLKSKGIRMFVISNKPDELAKIIVPHYLPSCFEGVQGQQEGALPKPDPSSTLHLIADFKLDKQETLYVGDSSFDVDTAHNALIRSVLVTWGYGYYSKELLSKSDYSINSPAELITLVESL